MSRYNPGSIVSFTTDSAGWTVETQTAGEGGWGSRLIPVVGWAVVASTGTTTELQPVVFHNGSLITANQWRALPEHAPRSGFAIVKMELRAPDYQAELRD